ncbi:hypothetical protein GEV02_21250 [Rugamonas sp. FT29W]|uniref:Mutator family transposase n=1 Tax=Rugamonas aquatica TaxID=2743357 RepID=A0A6A7N6G1_9BURK|nr:hypothetical protein [Rugamonas aquatica]
MPEPATRRQLALSLDRRDIRQNPSDRRIVSVAVIIAVAVNTDGVRKILRTATGTSETEPFLSEFLCGLTRRGPRGVKLVISDARPPSPSSSTRACSAGSLDHTIFAE